MNMAFDRSKGEPQLDLGEMQGDSLIGLQKDFEWFLFFRITDVAGFKKFVSTALVPRISTARKVLEREHVVSAHKAAGHRNKLDRGHEHFGFLDGVSQPGVRGQIDQTFPGMKFLQQSKNPDDPGQGLPGSDLVWPGEFVFGYPGQDPSDMDKPGGVVTGLPAW